MDSITCPRLGKQSTFQVATRTFSPAYPHQLGRHIARGFTIRIERLSLRETEQSITRGRRWEEVVGHSPIRILLCIQRTNFGIERREARVMVEG